MMESPRKLKLLLSNIIGFFLNPRNNLLYRTYLFSTQLEPWVIDSWPRLSSKLPLPSEKQVVVHVYTGLLHQCCQLSSTYILSSAVQNYEIPIVQYITRIDKL